VDREVGLEILKNSGWLSATPIDFRQAVLLRADWSNVDAGAPRPRFAPPNFSCNVVILEQPIRRADRILRFMGVALLWTLWRRAWTGIKSRRA
jgi:hypothetical protein